MLTNQAFSGYALMRLQFLQAEDPDSLREMESNGTLAGHLEKVERLTNERRSELELLLMQEEGATEAIKASDWGMWLSKAAAAQAKARELAIREVVEAI